MIKNVVEFRVVFAPWRYKYIQNIGKEGCFLCKAAREVDRDVENLVPVRGRHVFAILNKYPYTWGHVMVAPYRHVGQFEELTDEEWVEMIQITKRLVEALKKTVGAGSFVIGINVGRAAGAGLDSHIHLHIVPRDTRIDEQVDLEAALRRLTITLSKAYD
ncbi:MAG: HIT domain-containing protein [Pyrobaculum sp.]